MNRFLSNFQKFSFSSLKNRYLYTLKEDKINFNEFRLIFLSFLSSQKEKGKLILYNQNELMNNNQKNNLKTNIEILKWAGIKWDEEIGINIESEIDKNILKENSEKKKKLYFSYINTLIENQDAYYCFCHSNRLKEIGNKYDKKCLKLSQKEIDENLNKKIPYQIRFIPPKGNTKIEDIFLGKMEIENKQFEDKIIVKTNGDIIKEIMNIHDYHKNKISHLYLNKKSINSSYLEVMLNQTLDIPKINYGHLPQFVDQKGTIIKKNYLKTLDFFKEKDFLPETIQNFTFYSGWKPNEESEEKEKNKSLAELIELFSTELISIHSPLYIENNLNKINSNLIKKTLSDLDQEKPDVETIENFRSILIRHNSKLTEILKNLSMKQIAYLSKFLKKDLKYFSQLKNISFIFQNPDYNYDIISKKFKNIDKISQILDYFLNVLNSTKNLKKEEINKKCSEYIFINKKNVTNLDVFQGIKFVLTGKNYELLNLSEICEILGKEKIIERIENFNKICRNNKKSN